MNLADILEPFVEPDIAPASSQHPAHYEETEQTATWSGIPTGSQVPFRPADQAAQVARRRTGPILDIEMVLGIPDTDGNLVHTDLSIFGTSPESITARFQTDFLSTHRHRKVYDRLRGNLDMYFPRFPCINMFLHGANNSKDIPIASTMAGGDKMRACDGCTTSKRLCVRLERIEDNGMKLVVYPLAEKYRSGRDWTQLAFWVREP